MKMKIPALLLAALMLAALLGACGGDTSESESVPVVDSSVPAPPPPPTLEEQIAAAEQALALEGTPAQYQALAQMYAQAGMVRKQRDLLERNYRLTGDGPSFESLQGMAVNLKEESSSVQAAAQRLRQYLAAEEYLPEAVALVIAPEWLPTMMPKLSEGRRVYYLQENGWELVFEVGYDAQNDGLPYTRAWHYTPESGQVLCLVQQGDAVQTVQTTLENGQYNGAFTAWLCVASAGAVYSEAGTFAAGVLTGEFTSLLYEEDGEIDLYQLFATRAQLTENALEYTGSFEAGLSGLNQPGVPAEGDEDDFGFAVYGGNANGNYLFYNLLQGDAASGFVFDAAFLGLTPYPAYTPYDPVPELPLQGEVTVDLSQMQVRVYDGEVQWFDGRNWHNVGAAQDLIAGDPLGTMVLGPGPAVPPEANGEAGEGEEGEEAPEPGQNTWFARRGVYIKPVQTWRPPAAATPPPTPPPSNPNPNPPPAPPPEAPQPGEGDGDDIGYSPDML